MATNNAFAATDKEADALPEPITPATLAGWIAAGKKALWHWKKNISIGYDPFLVSVIAKTAQSLTYTFVNCKNGVPDTKQFTVDQNDLDVAHLPLPSTDLAKLDPASNKTIAFILLNPKRMSADATQTAIVNNQGDMFLGKWPATALDDTKLVEARQLIDELIAALPKVPDTTLKAFRQRADKL